MTALLFGSISSVADTSERQRQAFNDAFAQHGLEWHWHRDDYRAMLGRAGGRDRIAEYARREGADVDADAVHATKSGVFQKLLADGTVTPRPGVVETMRAALARGWQVGLVTTTSRENVTALLQALVPEIDDRDLAVVVDAGCVDAPKPDPAAYLYALDRLGIPAAQAVAVEDNPDGVASARSAGLACIAYPNENTAHLGFDDATARVERLQFDDVARLADAN